MSDLFDSLPGILLPVEKVSAELSRMWSEITEAEGSEFRASQLNLILHFGLESTTAEAVERFHAAIRFAQRYPARIIVLCPSVEAPAVGVMAQAKLFSQCYIGPSHREACCCEALIIHYEIAGFGYLSNQVSVWLEGDLPTYYWFHRVPAKRVGELYLGFMQFVRRVVVDSSVDDFGGFQEIAWPPDCRPMDLAVARALPVRQSLGQFLSRYRPEALRSDLVSVSIGHCPECRGEAASLAAWIERGLYGSQSQPDAGLRASFSVAEASSDCDVVALQIEWSYGQGKFLRFELGARDTHALLHHNFDGAEQSQTLQVRFFSAEQALAEALFF